MFLFLDHLSSFHMSCVGFPQSVPHPGDPLPLLHRLPILLSWLCLSSCCSSYISRVLHYAFFQLFP
jgi:hypothetical protein